MALPNNDRIDQYTAVGSEAQFAYTFPVNAAADIVVKKNVSGTITTLTLTTHYTVTSVGSASGGQIVLNTTAYPSGATAGHKFSIFGNQVVTRAGSSDFSVGGDFFAATINNQLDDLTQIAQDVRRDVNLSLKKDPAILETFDPLLPALTDRRTLVVNEVSTGNFNLVMSAKDPDTQEALAAAQVALATTQANNAATSASEASTSASNAATSFTDFDIRYLGAKSSEPSTNNSGGVLATGAIYFNSSSNTMFNYTGSAWVSLKPTSSDQTAINAVNSNASNINAVSTNIASVNTVATNITDVVAVASDLAEAVSEVVTVADDLNEATSEIDTVANNIANVNTVGGISANVTTVAGISANVTTVASNSSNITSVAGNETNINSVASNATNVNSVAGSISNVNLVGSSINNINSAVSSLSSINSFANTYRISSSAPTTSLDTGDLYFDTTADELKVYKNSGWAAAGSTVNGTSARYTYNISGTPTSVTGADANGNTLAYDAGYADVYLNGVRLSSADITITSGTSVVFASALANGDVVDIVGFGTFNVAAINASNVNSGTLGTDRLPTIPVAKGGTNLTALGNADEVLKVNSAGNALEYGTASSPEVYGFNVDATGSLIVTTTNKGADSITEATYATFDDVVYASSNMSWSLSGTNLRVTI